MASRRQGDPGLERFWRRTIKAWQRKGGPVRQFCVEQGVSEPSFYAWRRKLAERDGVDPRAKAEQKPRREKRKPSPCFIPIAVKPLGGVASIEIERGGTIIRLPRDVDLELLAGMVRALGRVSC